MTKRILTLAMTLLTTLMVWADETTIYERKASDGALSESTSATQVSALWSTKDIYNSEDEATAGGWTLEGTPTNVTASIVGGLKLIGNNSSKTVAFTCSKSISLNSSTSIVRLSTDWDYSKARVGNSETGDQYFSFLKIGDIEVRFSGKNYKIITICNGTTIQEEVINSAYFADGSYANISVTIDQSLKTVSYTINIYKSTSDPSPLVKTNTGTTGESVTYNLSAGYSKAGGGSATTDIIKNIKVTEEAQDVTLYSYTVNYKVGENVVKTVTSSLAEGSAIPVLTALDGEGDYTGNHYLISDDVAPSWIISSTVAENTHDVEVRAPYSTTLTVTRYFDGVAEATPYINGQALVETDEKVANWVYTFPYYVQNDDKWYRATLKDGKFGEEGTFATEAISKTIDYTLDKTVIKFFDYSHNNYVNNINYSGGSKNDYQQGETIGSLEAGIYEITVMQDASYSAKLYKDYTDSNSPGTELLEFNNSNRTKTLTLTETANNLQIASSGNSRYDYVLVRKVQYTITSSGENGTIVMKKNDANGETITSDTEVDGGTTIYVSATPNDGYSLTSLTKKEGGNEPVDIENGSTFTLQAATIITATFSAEKTAPTVANLAAASLTYTGAAQNLVTTPTVTGGTITYSTTADGTYSETIPTATNAGNYSVWYKVEGDETHNDIAATEVEGVKINKATNTLTGNLTIEGWTYGATANSPSGISATFGEVGYKYSNAENGEYGTYDAIVNGAVGTWWVKAYVDGTDNYTAVESNPVSFAISAATQTATITAEATQSTTYNGQAQPLTASVDQGTIIITYYTNEAHTEGETTEAPTNAGTYYAIVSQSDVNYTSDPVYVTFTINKATLTATAADATRAVGEDNPAFTVNVTGFVNDETTGNAAGYEAPISTTTADTNSEAGTYPITVSGGAATNYNFTYVPGTLTVTAPISEEYVSTTTTWVFNNLETSTVYNSIENISNGIYVRGGESSGSAKINRTFTVKDLASNQQITFSDGYTATISKYLETNGSFQNASSIATTTTAASSEMTTGNSPQLVGAGGMAFNTNVAGTLYVYMGLIEATESDTKLRVYYNNGSAITNSTVNTKTTEIVEVKVTGAAGTYTFGSPDVKYRIYAVRFVPTSEAKAAWVYIGANGYATFGNTTGSNLDLPEGLTAYSVKPGSASATLTALNGIPQTAGVVLKGSPSTNFPLTESSSSYSASNNYMIRLTANSSINATEEVESSTRYNYILTEDAAEAKFAKANGSILAKDKAYFRSTKDLGDNIDLTIVSGASVETAPAAVATELTYSGEAQSLVTEGQATGGTLKYFVNTSGEAPTTSTDGWTNTVPTGTNAGTYYIWYYVAGDASHTSTAVTAIEGGSKTIGKKVPSVSDFDYSAPADLAYSGIAKEATVVAKSNITGMGTVTLKYYKGETETTPTDIGTYTVKITVAEGSNYTASASELSGESWTFTITAETSTYTITGVSEDEHGNKVEASPTSAAESATITLTITTAESYVLTSISAKDADNGEVELSGSDATRTFTMPAKNVVVSATWTANAVQQADTGDSKTQESYSITDANNAQVTTITATSGATSVTIPSSVNGVPVTSISDDAFENVADKSNIKSIDLSTTSITGVTVDRTSGVFNGFPEETMIYMPAGNTEASGQKNVIINGKCSNFVMTDTKSYKIPKDFQAVSATISRTFTNGTYCTLCLPYTIPSGNLSGKVYEFSGVNDATVTMTESNDGLQANKPYIFVPDNNVDGMTISDNSIFIDISMNDSPNTVNTEAQFTFKGVYENMDFSSEVISNGVYGFAAEANYGASIGQFVKAANGASIKGMRAYLAYNGDLNGTSTASTRGIGLPEVLNVVLVSASGSTTNIGRLELMTAEDGSPVYNLNGQRVDSSYKGLVIKNGKKVVKK